MKDHIRSINKMSLSLVVPHYCITGSADGDLRVWVSFEFTDIRREMNIGIGPTGFDKVYYACSPSHICS